MRIMSERPVDAPEAVRKFAPRRKQSPHPTDDAGQALVAMLREAAKLSNESCDRLHGLAHDLERQLREAEERINQLEGDIAHFRGRALGAEKWLDLIQKEVEEKLVTPMSSMWPERQRSE